MNLPMYGRHDSAYRLMISYSIVPVFPFSALHTHNAAPRAPAVGIGIEASKRRVHYISDFTLIFLGDGSSLPYNSTKALCEGHPRFQWFLTCLPIKESGYFRPILHPGQTLFHPASIFFISMIDSFLHGLFTRRIDTFKRLTNRRNVIAIHGSISDGSERIGDQD